jgi:hypothetical protein
VLSNFYKDKNSDVISKRYAYYIAGQIGGRFDWMGQDLEICHKAINDNNYDKPENQISKHHLAAMITHFKNTLEEHKIGELE